MLTMSNYSNWKHWVSRNEFPDIKYPGVYSIAQSSIDLNDKSFDCIKEIIYFGMTNSKGGLKQRLKQFDNSISGKPGHGGAVRVLHKHKNNSDFNNNLFVSISVFKCNVTSNSPEDLLIMGKVAEYEYICLAEYVKRFNCLPEFNDKKRSPKN